MPQLDSGTPIDLDVKAVAEDGSGSFCGYASTFNVIDRGGDVAVPGSFTKSLTKYPPGKVKMLWQHNTDEPIGIWKSLVEDDVGLKAEGQLLLETSRGREAYALLKADQLALSIGFRTIKDEVDRKSGVRRLHEVELREISLVTFPMNESAVISGVKSNTNSFRALVEAINSARAHFKE